MEYRVSGYLTRERHPELLAQRMIISGITEFCDPGCW
ncbi:unnamed protein product [Penicillium camemberti]|uniref:Str. FM013 n=1 Tax=Penicillium camemberti (strain FM 013) TaxID=1429867 RepID=A0A0G4PMN9_PENC3|nr:unnamed protein product [Penicillium camemberti]